MLLLLTIVTSTGLICCQEYAFSFQKFLGYLHLLLSIFIEQSRGFSLVTKYKSKFLYGPLVLSFLVFSHAWKGQLLSVLLTAYSYSTPWERINDLMNFTIYSSDTPNFFSTSFNTLPFSREFQSAYTDIEISYYAKAASTELKKYRDLYVKSHSNTVKPKLLPKYEPNEFSGFSLLRNCNRTAYAVLNSLADSELQLANLMSKNNSIRFLKGKDEFRPTGFFWRFSAHYNSFFLTKLHKIRESGIYQLWERYIEDARSGVTRDFQFKVHSGLELDPQLKYLFYLWSSGLGLAFLFCCIEMSWIKFKCNRAVIQKIEECD